MRRCIYESDCIRDEANSEIRPRGQRYVSLFSFPFALLQDLHVALTWLT
jgi:hypothetical protein